MPQIHPTAIVDPSVKLADDVFVGPYSIIEHDVKLGPGCRLIAHCYVGCYTTMGKNNTIYPFASIGTNPQDYAFDNSVTYTHIGDDNCFREGVTVNRATGAGCITKIGSHCLFMANAHVAHNCVVGDYTIFVAFSAISGHCVVGDHCLISGFSGVHQFCRVGRLAVLSGGSQISVDLPPFMIGDGRNGGVRGYNIVGLRRNGFSNDRIQAVKEIYKIFFREGLNTTNATNKVLAEVPQTEEVKEFLDFVSTTKRGILTGDHHGRRS